ncbi:MATE family efflux transporter, partial [Dehalococcoidia bacterium]|nr:MATE family efflux transporter [Dehalococcoidia bacterium]
MNKPKEELLNESMMSLFFRMSVPAMVGMLAIGLYNLMDAIFVGRLVGESALGGIAVAFPFTMINTGIAVLIGIGSASVLSRAIGSGKQSIVDKILGNLIVVVFALSLVVTIAGYIYTEDLLKLVGASGDILLQGALYLRVIFLGSFFVNFAQSANMLLRGEGRMKAAMLIMLVGTILNIILNPFLIVVFDMGIRGAAVATVISQVFMAVHTLLYFIKGQSAVKLNQLRLAPELMSGIPAVGVSAMLMQVMNLFQQAVLFRVLSIYGGDEHVILMGAAMRVMMFAFIPIWGLVQGLQPVVGTNYGAKQYERVKKAVKTFAVAATIIMFIFWLPIQLFPKAILGMFFQDGQIIELGYNLFRLMVVLFP